MLQNYAMLFEFMQTLGKKWTVPLLLFLLFYKESNFSEIKKNLKMTSRALSKKLKLLEALGLVERIIIENPKKAYYSLSEKGMAVSQMVIKFAASFSE